jgi:hypothetical protein
VSRPVRRPRIVLLPRLHAFHRAPTTYAVSTRNIAGVPHPSPSDLDGAETMAQALAHTRRPAWSAHEQLFFWPPGRGSQAASVWSSYERAHWQVNFRLEDAGQRQAVAALLAEQNWQAGSRH